MKVYSASSDGNRIALQLSRPITANGSEIFDLALLNRETREITPIIENLPPINEISISPDGHWIAYGVSSEIEKVFLVSTTHPKTAYTVAECVQGKSQTCPSVAWSPDSRSLLWDDSRGLWAMAPDSLKSTLIHPNLLQTTDPRGGTSEIVISFSEIKWSPEGRFVIARITPSASAVSWYGLVDVRKKRLIEVPDTYRSDQRDSNVAWLTNGRLAVSVPSDLTTATPSQVKLFDVAPTKDNILVQTDTLALDSLHYPELMRIDQMYSDTISKWLYLNSADELNFVLLESESDAPIQMYSLNINYNALQKILEIPNNSSFVYWSPDGSSVLIHGTGNQLLLASLNSKEVKDLNPILGEDAKSFNWLPPSLQS